jgi:hypothetical protein
MAAQPKNQPSSREGRGALMICFGLFAIYFVNVLLGKISIAYNLKIPHVGSVAEFLLLFGACVLLIVAALKREKTEKNI